MIFLWQPFSKSSMVILYFCWCHGDLIYFHVEILLEALLHFIFVWSANFDIVYSIWGVWFIFYFTNNIIIQLYTMSLLKRLLPAAAGPCRRNMSDIRTVTLIPGDGIGKPSWKRLNTLIVIIFNALSSNLLKPVLRKILSKKWLTMYIFFITVQIFLSLIE